MQDRTMQLLAEVGFKRYAAAMNGETEDKDIYSEPAFSALWNAADAVTTAEARVRELAVRIEDIAQRVQKKLDGGYHLNSLGELQSTGSQFDAAIVERESRVDALKQMASLVRRLQPAS